MVKRISTRERMACNSEEARNKKQELLGSMCPALRNKADWILSWVKNESRASLVGRWELGTQVREIMKDERNGEKVYGPNAISKLEQYIGEPAAIMRHAAMLAGMYSKNEIIDISEMTLADHITPVSYSHIRALLSLKDKQLQQKWLNKAIENCWSSDELSKAIREASITHGHNPHGRAGKPKGVDGIIAQQIAFADSFEKANAGTWTDPKTSLKAQVDKLTDDEYNEELINRLGEVAHRLRQLANEAAKRAKEAEEQYEKVLAMMTKGKTGKLKLAAPDDEEELDEEPDEGEDEFDDEDDFVEEELDDEEIDAKRRGRKRQPALV